MNPVLQAIEPGLFTTLQDLGRLNAVASGVPPGGAMDRFAHTSANLLAGNAPQDAALECTMSGPVLLAEQPCVVAVTGADFDPRVNGATVQMWASIFLARGDRLSFGGRRSGARTYIAVAGGFEADKWLGSRSTNILAVHGGLHGRQLRAGDALSVASERTAPSIAGRALRVDLWPDYSSDKLLAVPGPHFKRLDAEGRRLLFSATFRMSRDADRMGSRLEGPRLVTSGDELLSFGLVAGAVQLPHSGQPILLMADHQTAGGYPVVACVVSADLPKAAQLLPGDALHFKEVSVTTARDLRMRLETALDELR